MTQSDKLSTEASPDAVPNATSSFSLEQYYKERLSNVRKNLPVAAEQLAMFESYIKVRQPELAACTLRNAILCIRAFLQFCFERGLLKERVDVIDRPLGLSDDKPPRALAWPMIQRFLRSIDRSDWVGRRDYLILHLMAYYGLRPGEVGLLTLDAIDRARGTMTINQEKTLSTLIRPSTTEQCASCDHLSKEIDR